jgi:hypothetical protein
VRIRQELLRLGGSFLIKTKSRGVSSVRKSLKALLRKSSRVLSDLSANKVKAIQCYIVM